MIEAAPAGTADPDALRVEDGRLVVEVDQSRHTLHPLWLFERSAHAADVDATSRQRLIEPFEMAPDFAVGEARWLDARELEVAFTDGRLRRFALDQLRSWIGGDPDVPPRPRPWSRRDDIPTVAWEAVVDDRVARREIVGALHEVGCFVISGTPTVPGSLMDIAGRFGRVSVTNFGTLFDVVSVIDPEDLAYTPVGLSAHIDQPYRQPTPGVQLLHTLVNDAPGGESTVADGLAAVDALRRHDPVGHAILSQLAVEFRYDIGTDVVVASAPIIDLRPDGSLRQLRFSTRLDFAPCTDPDVLDHYYAARRWLAEWLNDEQHRYEFKLDAGDVLVVDNHRVLHGRRPFEPSQGRRHLQGCYIDHDGPATMWRMLNRSEQRTGDQG